MFEGLAERGAGLVYCDMPKLAQLPDGKSVQSPFIGPNAYIRLHGRNAAAWYASGVTPNGSGRYRYDYSDAELAGFVCKIPAGCIRENEKYGIFLPCGSASRWTP